MATRAEAALLALLGFEWSDAYGMYIGPGYTRYDTLEEALEEACAQVEGGRVEQVTATVG